MSEKSPFQQLKQTSVWISSHQPLSPSTLPSPRTLFTPFKQHESKESGEEKQASSSQEP